MNTESRIVQVLSGLGPMTAHQLAMALAINTNTARRKAANLLRAGSIRICGAERTHGRPWNVYEVAV